jgi:hypothetical protein
MNEMTNRNRKQCQHRLTPMARRVTAMGLLGVCAPMARMNGGI